MSSVLPLQKKNRFMFSFDCSKKDLIVNLCQLTALDVCFFVQNKSFLRQKGNPVMHCSKDAISKIWSNYPPNSFHTAKPRVQIKAHKLNGKQLTEWHVLPEAANLLGLREWHKNKLCYCSEYDINHMNNLWPLLHSCFHHSLDTELLKKGA